jgi:PKD repeat protein
MTRLARIAPLLLVVLLVWAGRPEASPSEPTFDFTPANPVVGADVRFTASVPGNTSVVWSFGDGTQSSRRAPVHRFLSPGSYRVTLTSGSTTVQRVIHVTLPQVLRLNPIYPFEVTATAVHPANGSTTAGLVMPQTTYFGYFSFPAASGIYWNPEALVKILSTETPGEFRLYWNGMTNLEFTITVRDLATGASREYRKPAGESCGGVDTWLADPSAIPPTPTPTQTIPPGGFDGTPPAETPTPTRTLTPSVTPIPIVTVILSARTWQWNIFCPEHGANGEPNVTLYRGRPYRILVENGDIESTQFRDHSFSGIPDLELSGGPLPNAGEALPPQFITPTVLGDFPFLCTDPLCGSGHAQMLGVITVVDPP